MNCKQGQLVRYIGRDVTRIAPTCYGWVGKTVRLRSGGDDPEWDVSPPIETNDGLCWCIVFDRSLRPIDGGESPEESVDAMRELTGVESEVSS